MVKEDTNAEIRELYITELLDRFIESIKYEKQNSDGLKNDQLDIPFIISSLYQSFKNNTTEYEEFISDLEKYSDYGFCIEDSRNDYNGIIDVYVYLSEYKSTDDCDTPNYDYLLSFTYDFREYGYCMCTPEMKDYREDKKCCGHGCDAAFCEFLLQKISYVKRYSWHGDEHDYWDFEDKFYASDKKLADNKAEEERKYNIERLRKQIEAATKQLAELEGANIA